MRAFLLVALALLPGALAQAPDVELIRLSIAPFGALVPPLQSPLTTEATVEVSCPTQAVQDAQVHVFVVEAPDWATVLLSPASFAIDRSRCQTETAREKVAVIVTATDRAPAFRAEPILLAARLAEAPTEQNATASVDVTASYFSILDVQLTEAIKTAPPDADVPYTIRVTNHGNARTKVSVETTQVSEGLGVEPVPAFELGSRQAGDADLERDVVVTVRSAAGGAYVNEVGVVELRLTSVSAANPGYAGSDATVSLLLTTRSELPSPSAGAAVALTALVGVAVAMRRQAGR